MQLGNRLVVMQCWDPTGVIKHLYKLAVGAGARCEP